MLLAAAVCLIALSPSPAAAASPARSEALVAPASQVKPPADFWRSARQAVSIANRDAAVRRRHARSPALHGRAYVADLGLWVVVYRDRHGIRDRVMVEDRTGDILEPSTAAYPPTGGIGSAADTVDLICLALALLLLAVLFDFGRPLRLRNLDLLALLSLTVAVPILDHGDPLTGIPLTYPPLLYLGLRLAWLGFRGGGDEGPLAPWASNRLLLIGLVGLVVGRIAANLLIGGVSDVGYASVFGANSIQAGWPLYVQDHIHLDTYGPVTYLAYLPFQAIFPLPHNWQHDYLPAAHAAAIAFDLLTMLGLFALGRRLRDGSDGRRLGLVLAFAWAACPFTFLNLMANTNDGLVPLFVVAALVAIRSPVRRGVLLGLGAAAKFAPLALAGLFATARGDRGRRSVAFAISMAAVVAVSVLAYSQPGGVGVFWDQTIGFQLHRHSMFSLWGQYPQLHPLQLAFQGATLMLALAVTVPAGRRTTAQVAALSGAILVGLELSATHWYSFYVSWFMPGVLLGLLAVGLPERAPDAAPQAVPAAARRRRAALEPAGY